MTELTPDAYPNVPLNPDMPLAYFNVPDEHVPRALYVFDTPELRERYVMRPLAFEYARPEPRFTLEEQLRIYRREYDRLRAAGVNVPRVVAGLPEDFNSDRMREPYSRERQDVMLVVDQIQLVDPATVDQNLMGAQARSTITGLIKYLSDSLAPERRDPENLANAIYLRDVFADYQFEYGRPPDEGSDPDFYMLDVGAELDDTISFRKIPRHCANIMATAQRFASMCNDPQIVTEANQQLNETGVNQYR